MSAPVGSWGRYPAATGQSTRALADRFAPLPQCGSTLLAHGAGRSYGDVCLNPGGTVLLTRSLDRFIRFDAQTGQLECEAGVTLDQILQLVVPQGWFLPVTPGTRFVTVGGAIANDVHGKNHHQAGSFGDHVLELELVRTNGLRRVCSRQDHADWFQATVGGLGLTGVITRAVLQLRRIPGEAMQVLGRRFAGLGDFFSLSRDCSGSEYTVAWVDCLARGAALGRGVFMSADHVACGRPVPPPGRNLKVPFGLPVSPVNQITLRAFNSFYFHRAPKERRTTCHYDPFFYPLDAIEHWNRLYGARGFLQYQCVVPPAAAREAMHEILDRIAKSGQGSFLAVLKNFGEHSGPGLLSFPRPGTTLALDFPMRGDRTLQLLRSLDEVVASAGGALYPAKDARMPPAMFRSSFPALDRFRNYVDPGISSGLWRRVTEEQ